MESQKLDQILGIVKTMAEHGVSASDIRVNLIQLGLSDSDISQILEAAKVGTTAKEIHETVSAVKETLKQATEEQAVKTDELHEKVDDITSTLEQHAENLEEISSTASINKQKLEEVHESVSELHEKVCDNSAVLDGIEEVKQLVLELTPMVAALRDINGKILETNRDVLMRLKGKI